MEPLDEHHSRRILEVAQDASLDEITRSYHLLKQIHGKDGGVFSAPAMDEFAGDVREDVLEEIEAAYTLLRGLLLAPAFPVPQPHPPQAPAQPPPPAQPLAQAQTQAQAQAPQRKPPAERTYLAQAREAAGLSLDQVFAETNVRMDYLQALEDETFESLHLPAVNVRGYLTALVNAIGLPAEQVVPAYMQKFTDWQSRQRTR